MDKISSCIEHIRLIRKACGGIITNEQIELLLISYNLDGDEQLKKKVFEFLEKDGIVPISEEELHPKVQVSNVPPQSKAEHKAVDEQSRNARRKERFDMLLNEYKKALKEKPNIAKLFEIEKPIFTDSIIAPKGYIGKTASQRIARAVISISKYRQCEELKNGWLCGTYMHYVIEHLERWVRIVFNETELSELIACIVEGKALTDEQDDMIRVLLHNAPSIFVNQHRLRTSDLLDD